MRVSLGEGPCGTQPQWDDYPQIDVRGLRKHDCVTPPCLALHVSPRSRVDPPPLLPSTSVCDKHDCVTPPCLRVVRVVYHLIIIISIIPSHHHHIYHTIIIISIIPIIIIISIIPSHHKSRSVAICGSGLGPCPPRLRVGARSSRVV